MARTTIFPTQEILYDFLFMDMVPAASIIPAPFALEPGQTYAVQWGENLFENLSVIDLADAGFTGGAIGNCSGFELPGNNEPFAIAYFADDTGGEIVVFFLDGSDSQTITVYQESAESLIVLKDRTGTGIEYEGVEGVRVFDKAGNAHVFVPPVETEEKTVELDFSGGAMEVTPTAGKLLSKVGIPVPETLVPENIAKDVDIAGVVGTHEGGGGGTNSLMPCMFMCYNAQSLAQNSTNMLTPTSTLNVPKSAIILWNMGGFGSSNVASISSSGNTLNRLGSGDLGSISPTITEASSFKTLTYKNTMSSTTTSTRYRLALSVMIVLFNLPGVYWSYNEDGLYDIYADSTATELSSLMLRGQGIRRIDLSESQIKSIPIYFAYNIPCQEVLLPSTITAINTLAFRYSALDLLDLSRATSVPSLGSNGISIRNGGKILVPASLYDAFTTDGAWAGYSSYMVAV